MLFAFGLGTRFRLSPFPVGFPMLKWAAFLGIGVALVALIGLLVPRLRAGGGAHLVVSAALGLGVAAVPAYGLQAGRQAPPIHDISTDLADPPAFIAVLPRRDRARQPRRARRRGRGRSRAPGLSGHPVADARAWPGRGVRARFARGRVRWAGRSSRRMSGGRIEATVTSFWFGFKDDVVVGIVPPAAGSRIDGRSLSRVGVGDAG